MQLYTVMASKQDNTLAEAVARMRELRKWRITQTASTWDKLVESMSKNMDMADFCNVRDLHRGDPLMDAALEKAGPETPCGLTEGEAAALLLCVATRGYRDESVYSALQGGFPPELDRYRLLVATLVSALRKLRECSTAAVPCVRACDAYAVPPTDDVFVACGFLHATRSLTAPAAAEPPMFLIPHERRATVLPECFRVYSGGCDVVFEPGTAFCRIAPNVYAELPRTDAVPVYEPEVQTFPEEDAPGWNTLVLQQQCLLLYPLHTRFLPVST